VRTNRHSHGSLVTHALLFSYKPKVEGNQK
jgi:hypothetical protein